MDTKYNLLKSMIREMEGLVVAFSGGVDSSFLLKTAFDTIGDRVLAVTARSSTYPASEYQEAQNIAKFIGARHIVIVSEELDIPGFSKNPVDRCYYCKKELFTKLKDVAVSHGIPFVADGSNLDDIKDYRPGMQAARELAIRSPLKEAGLTKQDIRILSKALGLPTWDKPSFACLASRFPYGDRITAKKLEMVDSAESFIKGIGIRQVRVRHHGDIARIEVDKAGEHLLMLGETRDNLISVIKNLGFKYVTIDIEGYRTGSMNI